jgi:hypothetical protein
MFVDSWDDFMEASKALYAEDPVHVSCFPALVADVFSQTTPLGGPRRWLTRRSSRWTVKSHPLAADSSLFARRQTRYNIKYRTSEGQLVLKVTDDRAVSLPEPHHAANASH